MFFEVFSKRTKWCFFSLIYLQITVKESNKQCGKNIIDGDWLTLYQQQEQPKLHQRPELK